MHFNRRFALPCAALVLGVGMMCRSALAQPAAAFCARAGRPWVSIAYSGQAWDPQLRSSVTQDLRAGLELQGIDVCPLGSEGGEAPLALIEMRASQENRIAVSIDVHDAVTEKRVLRDVNLDSLPDDGHGLALAVAAEELLRASWAELALTDHPKPRREPPPEVRRAIERTLAAPPRRLLGARFAFEYHGQGLILLGGDAMFAHFPVGWLGYELALRVRRGLAEASSRGRVDASALGGSAAWLVAPWGTERATSLQVRLGVAVSAVAFEGVAEDGARDMEALGIDVHGLLGVGLRQRLLPTLNLTLEAALGAPFVSVAAADGDRTVTGTGGLQLGLSAGVEARF